MRIASQYTSEADLSESLWQDIDSRFARGVPISYVHAPILIPIYGVATTLHDRIFNLLVYSFFAIASAIMRHYKHACTQKIRQVSHLDAYGSK